MPFGASRLYSLLVNETLQDVTAKPRRNRSRQRERMLAWVRATDEHPTASEIHNGLRIEMPSVSLGTVYRNLEILVADGEIDEVPCGMGASRYDGDLRPHHHFHCEGCGRILDVDLPEPRGLSRRLATDHGLISTRMRINFFGLCPNCDGASRDETD